MSSGVITKIAAAAGTATEKVWLNLFDPYLPQRFKATPAFVIDSLSHRSRQIDIAIYDQLNYAPPFPHPSGPYLPAESIRAVFEIKPAFSKQWLRDAHEKASSAEVLQSTPKILTGLLATTSVWTEATLSENLDPRPDRPPWT